MLAGTGEEVEPHNEKHQHHSEKEEDQLIHCGNEVKKFLNLSDKEQEVKN